MSITMIQPQAVRSAIGSQPVCLALSPPVIAKQYVTRPQYPCPEVAKTSGLGSCAGAIKGLPATENDPNSFDAIVCGLR